MMGSMFQIGWVGKPLSFNIIGCLGKWRGSIARRASKGGPCLRVGLVQHARKLLFLRLLGGLGFVRRLVGVLSRLFLEIGFEFLPVDFAVLVGVDFVEVLSEGSAFELLKSQPAVGVLVEIVKLRAALCESGSRSRPAFATLVGHEPRGRPA